VLSSVRKLVPRRLSGSRAKKRPPIESPLVVTDARVVAVRVNVEFVTLVPKLEFPSLSPLVARTDCDDVLASPNIGFNMIDSRLPPAMGLFDLDPTVVFVKAVPRLEFPSVSPLVARTEYADGFASPSIGFCRIDSRLPPAIGLWALDPKVGAESRTTHC
jgi:hypothetical protein